MSFALKHTSAPKVPDVKSVRDPKIQDIMLELIRFVNDGFSRIYDDLELLSGYMPHTVFSDDLTFTKGGVYIFAGSGAKDATLPDLAKGKHRKFFIKNRGSATLTLNRAGTDQIWDTAAVNTLSITAGQSYLITSDGTYWIVFDLN